MNCFVRALCYVLFQRTFVTVDRTRRGLKTTLFGIFRTTTTANGVETLGRGGIQQLQTGDQLSMTAVSGYSVYADSDFQISFFGFLIYRT